MINKDYIRLLRRRYSCNETEDENSETLSARETFNTLLDEKLASTVHTVTYIPNELVGTGVDGVRINVNVTNTAKNDQKTNDEKTFDFKWTDNPQCGDLLYWHEQWWVLFHEEHNAVHSHRSFVARQCNHMHKCIHNDVIVEIPIALINLTLYSDGLADKVYMSNLDGKRRVIITDNEATKYFAIGSRIAISHNAVFEVTHIDDFTRPGVKECIVQQVFTTSKDDLENNLAYNKDEHKETEDIILGNDFIYLGSNEIYEVNIDLLSDVKIFKWSIVAEDNCVTIDEYYKDAKDGLKCKIICTDDISYIGTTVTLVLEPRNQTAIEKKILVKGMF